MKNYTTKPIDFTGCHPVIAEALKRGELIECFVYDSPSCEYKRRWVLAYYVGNKYPYRTGEEAYCYAEPISIKTKRIMPPERAIPVLIAEGWEYLSNGTLYSFGKEPIHIGMFSLMGRSIEDPYVRRREWPPCIIE